MDKLEEIMRWKRREIEPTLRPVEPGELEAHRRAAARRGDFLEALRRPRGLALIAEIKRRSPSAGSIKANANPVEQASRYLQAGADALSVLTDAKYFDGRLEDLRAVARACPADGAGVPCLRKDFMIHPIQVLQAVQAGAAAILIIVRALEDDEMKRLREAADLAGLDCLYEVHSEPELEAALRHDPKIVGVNNRDLARFETDLAYSEKLLPLVPEGVVGVSESGIWSGADAACVRAAGAKAVLVGEALMKAEDPAALARALREA